MPQFVLDDLVSEYVSDGILLDPSDYENSDYELSDNEELIHLREIAKEEKIKV